MVRDARRRDPVAIRRHGATRDRRDAAIRCVDQRADAATGADSAIGAVADRVARRHRARTGRARTWHPRLSGRDVIGAYDRALGDRLRAGGHRDARVSREVRRSRSDEHRGPAIWRSRSDEHVDRDCERATVGTREHARRRRALGRRPARPTRRSAIATGLRAAADRAGHGTVVNALRRRRDTAGAGIVGGARPRSGPRRR